MAILCAVDFSKPSALALSVAEQVATRLDQPLTVITVADPLLAAAEQVQSGFDASELTRQALAAFVDETLGEGASTRHALDVLIGGPAAEISKRAEADDVDLIVIGTQGASGLTKFVFGSVAERMLRRTTRPVLVVPPAYADRPRRTLGAMEEVLAPVDFHEFALDDVRVAARVARASGARLRLLHVFGSGDHGGWSLLRAPAALEIEAHLSGVRKSQDARAQEGLKALVNALGDDAPPTEIEVARASGVADAIARVADHTGVDLVVLGLRGATGTTGAPVGAIAYRVLVASPVPVLALPRDTGGRDLLPFLR